MAQALYPERSPHVRLLRFCVDQEVAISQTSDAAVQPRKDQDDWAAAPENTGDHQVKRDLCHASSHPIAVLILRVSFPPLFTPDSPSPPPPPPTSFTRHTAEVALKFETVLWLADPPCIRSVASTCPCKEVLGQRGNTQEVKDVHEAAQHQVVDVKVGETRQGICQQVDDLTRVRKHLCQDIQDGPDDRRHQQDEDNLGNAEECIRMRTNA